MMVKLLIVCIILFLLFIFGVRCVKAYKEMRRVERTPLRDYRSYSYNSISRDRIKVIWKEDGGEDKDGVIFIRDGALGLCMGEHQYVQARIIVDMKYYLKGMAVLCSEWSEKNNGFDIVVYTAKSKNEPDKVFRPITDWNNPFDLPAGRRTTNIYDDHNHLSAINVVATQDDWAKWSSYMAEKYSIRDDKENMFPVGISDAEFRDFIIEYLLGDDWYVADPLGQTQVNEIALDEILERYSKRYKKESKLQK